MESQGNKKGPTGERKPRVFVGLSGGVDSAVSAALLKKAGYEVTGVFIKAWSPSFADEGVDSRKYPCTWKEDRRSAMRAAAVLDIPFLTLDLEKEYKREVVDYMINEYREGRTPNPDVMCNKQIKFGHFLRFALSKGADFVATGHYARTSNSKLPRKDSLKKSSDLLVHKSGLGQTFIKNFSGQLLEGADKNKDQSYFLWTLTREQLEHTLFPVGDFQKKDVRKLAHKFGLPQEVRKDSQGLCFLGKIDMKEFLQDVIRTKKGQVLNEKGEVIGEHDGALLYTLGERHGFRVSNKQSESLPLYVVAKDIKQNTLTVSAGKSLSVKPTLSQTIQLSQVNWVSGEPDPDKFYECRLRYRQTKLKCQVKEDLVILSEPQIDISPGQSLVVYDGEVCLGGGVIV